MATTPTVGKVYEAIAAVMAELSVEGISKGRKNETQGYKFRGIDDVFNALSPILSKHKLCMLPRILTRDVTERLTKNGGALFYVTVEAEFDLISAEDGSKHTIRTFGEAMDSGDKATNKAMSAAYKYAALQAFAIPTEGDNDADAQTVEVVPAAAKTNAKSATVRFTAEIAAAKTEVALKAIWDRVQTTPVDELSEAAFDELTNVVNARLAEIKPPRAAAPDPFGFDRLGEPEAAH